MNRSNPAVTPGGIVHKRASCKEKKATRRATRHDHTVILIWWKIEILRKQAVLNFGSRPTAHWQMESDRRKNGNLANDCHGRALPMEEHCCNEKEAWPPFDPMRFARAYVYTKAK